MLKVDLESDGRFHLTDEGLRRKHAESRNLVQQENASDTLFGLVGIRGLVIGCR
jgi:hypothetical protein